MDKPDSPGELKARAEAEVAERGLGGHVRFVGWVTSEQVPAWLRAAQSPGGAA